ncbi:MAG: hypothetical protein ACKV2U_04210, partial [Bryobacteraceae bacterium]
SARAGEGGSGATKYLKIDLEKGRDLAYCYFIPLDRTWGPTILAFDRIGGTRIMSILPLRLWCAWALNIQTLPPPVCHLTYTPDSR